MPRPPTRARLVRGLQGLAIRLAKALNRALGRGGTVWGDRYHARVLRTPREVRATLVSIAVALTAARSHIAANSCWASGRWNPVTATLTPHIRLRLFEAHKVASANRCPTRFDGAKLAGCERAGRPGYLGVLAAGTSSLPRRCHETKVLYEAGIVKVLATNRAYLGSGIVVMGGSKA